jgi:glycerol kinase
LRLKSELADLEVGGGMMNGDVAMEMLADVSSFEVVRPQI